MNIYTGLLFQHGHIADPTLAIALAEEAAPTASPPEAPAARASRIAPSASSPALAGGPGLATRLLHNFAYLGGRPMTAGHNDDIDEPFPPPARAAQRTPCLPFKRGAIAAVCGTVALSPFR